MAHHETDQYLSPEEKNFLDLISHGEDFMKIQIYRNAREFYEKALKTNFNNDLVNAKLNECNALIKKESKIIIAIVSVLALAAITLLIIF